MSQETLFYIVVIIALIPLAITAVLGIAVVLIQLALAVIQGLRPQ